MVAASHCCIAMVRDSHASYARIVCSCGSLHTVDLGEDGPEFETRACADEFCQRQLCAARQVQCADCDAVVCLDHSIELRGRVYCRPCGTAEMAATECLLEAV